MEKEFWKHKSFEEMNRQEWESLCDGCGKCCLIRLEDEDTGDIAITDVACKYLDLGKCKCKDYENRRKNVPDCLVLNPEMIKEYQWLPDTCAYRLLKEGRELYGWHPLISKNPDSVHEAGISRVGHLVCEDDVDDVEDHVIEIIQHFKMI